MSTYVPPRGLGSVNIRFNIFLLFFNSHKRVDMMWGGDSQPHVATRYYFVIITEHENVSVPPLRGQKGELIFIFTQNVNCIQQPPLSVSFINIMNCSVHVNAFWVFRAMYVVKFGRFGGGRLIKTDRIIYIYIYGHTRGSKRNRHFIRLFN